jgi:hypothetical protein
LRRMEYCETNAPTICRWLVWTKTQGFTADDPLIGDVDISKAP